MAKKLMSIRLDESELKDLATHVKWIEEQTGFKLPPTKVLRSAMQLGLRGLKHLREKVE